MYYEFGVGEAFFKTHKRATWVARLVGSPTLEFSLGHDLRVPGLSPILGSVLNRKSARGVSLPSFAPLRPMQARVHSLSF